MGLCLPAQLTASWCISDAPLSVAPGSQMLLPPAGQLLDPQAHADSIFCCSWDRNSRPGTRGQGMGMWVLLPLYPQLPPLGSPQGCSSTPWALLWQAGQGAHWSLHEPGVHKNPHPPGLCSSRPSHIASVGGLGRGGLTPTLSAQVVSPSALGHGSLI